MPRDPSILSGAYRYFLAVADAGSIRAAARDLNIVPSAVNRQLLMLERQIGIDLFERVGRGIRLSEAGQALLRHVREVLDAHDDALGELDAFRGLRRGRVRVATVESVSVHLLPALMAGFRRLHAGIEFAVTVTGSEAVTRLTAAADADFGFTFNPVSTAGLDVLFAHDYRVGALMAPDHPLAGRAHLTLEDVAEHPIALPARGLSLRAVLDPALRRLPRAPRPRLEANSLRLMAAAARREGLVAFQTEVGIEDERAAGRVAFVPLSDPDIPADRFVLVAPRGRTPSLAVAAFRDYAGDALAERIGRAGEA